MNTAGSSREVWVGRIETFATIAGPTSIVAALLFYFGYVATLARYAYFGVDLSALDLSFSELVLLGTEVIYVPLAAAILLALGVALVHHWARTALRRRGKRTLLRAVAGVLVAVGVVGFVRGALGVLLPTLARHEPPGITPMTFGFGLPIMGYGIWLLSAARGTGRQRRRTSPDALLIGLVIGLVALAVLGLFWATNTFASAYGRGRAAIMAEELHRRPAVVLDTQERLYLTVSGIVETALPNADGQRFRFRYRGLHLLTEGGGRLFLVPGEWSGRVATVVVPYDDSVRVVFFPR